MLLSLFPQPCSRQAALDDRTHTLCPRFLCQKLLATGLFMLDSMNYLVSALAVRQVSAPTAKDISNGAETEEEDAVSGEEAEEREGNDGLVEEEENEEADGDGDGEGVPTAPKIAHQQQRKSPRTKTRLHFCHPPPSTKQRRLRTRPKVLLQLQRKSKASRPVPTYDVLSTTAFTTRFAPQTLKGKGSAGAEELAVVMSEDYSYKEAQAEDFDDVLQDDVGAREVVATISHHGAEEPGSFCGADVCVSKQRTWAGTPMARGGYEFVAVEETGHRLVARWVPRKRPRTQSSGSRSSSPVRMPEARAFNFSLLDPRSRRHAVIATFDAQELEILDRYSAPKAEAGNRTSMSTLDAPSEFNDADMKEVDESLRRLIVATSVWVSYCEGFISSIQTPVDSPRARIIDSADRRKTSLMDIKDLKKGTTALERPASMQGLTTPTSPASTPIPTPPFSILPRRTQSTGSTVMSQSPGRQSLSKRAETMLPIFDTDTEGSPIDSRTSLEDEAGFPGFQIPKETVEVGAAGEGKNGKRAKGGIKKLCCSLGKKERGSSSS